MMAEPQEPRVPQISTEPPAAPDPHEQPQSSDGAQVPKRPKLDPTEVALFLAMCAVLAIAGAAIIRAMVTNTVPRGAPAGVVPAARSAAGGTDPGAEEAGSGVQIAGVRTQTAVAGTWQEGPPLPTERSEVAAAVVDGTIYVLGGLANDGHTLQ